MLVYAGRERSALLQDGLRATAAPAAGREEEVLLLACGLSGNEFFGILGILQE